ncbi:MAG: TolC family protein [Tannerellaceae bacterium]|nr:TolC family protein [Tannerellaceae bacterium]
MKNNLFILLIYTLLSLLVTGSVYAQQTVTLSLGRTIELAADSSLQSFRSKNLYLSSYWEYRTFKAARLPSLNLNLTPAEYYRYITQRYDFDNDLEVFRRQQTYSARGGLEINQNFDLLGGSFYVNSDLEYLRNFGATNYSQYTSVPIRVGYYQSLLGYNPFRWEKKIEPLKYEKAKKELVYNLEEIGEQATGYFFALAMAQVEYDMAKDIAASSDTLYRIGQERHKIASITQANLLTLKLDAINAKNSLKNAEIALKRAMFNLATFLSLDKNTEIRLRIPGRPRNLYIQLDEALGLARENNPSFLDMRQQIMEAEQQVDKTRKESLFDASIRASVGFNQVSDKFKDAYRDLLQQDIVSVSLSIPLLDWGVRKGRYNMARNNLAIVRITAEQEEISVEENVIMTVSEFNMQQDLISSAEEALELALLAYAETKQRFIIGKEDINSLTLSLQRQQDAQRNHILALQNYWLSYFKIRKLTLHDFETGVSLVNLYEYKHGF